MGHCPCSLSEAGPGYSTASPQSLLMYEKESIAAPQQFWVTRRIFQLGWPPQVLCCWISKNWAKQKTWSFEGMPLVLVSVLFTSSASSKFAWCFASLWSTQSRSSTTKLAEKYRLKLFFYCRWLVLHVFYCQQRAVYLISCQSKTTTLFSLMFLNQIPYN